MHTRAQERRTRKMGLVEADRPKARPEKMANLSDEKFFFSNLSNKYKPRTKKNIPGTSP